MGNGTVSIPKSEYTELLMYREMVTVLEDMLHEPKFKKDFVKRVLEAEERVKKGEKVAFKSVKEMSAYLDKMEE